MSINRNYFKLSCLVALLVCASCSSNPYKLTELGRRVELVGSQPQGECDPTGPVTGKNEFGSLDVAINQARNKAGDLGANTIYIKDKVSNGKEWEVFVESYYCR